MFDEDIGALFSDGKLATFGSQTAHVWLNMPDQTLLSEGQMSTDYTIEYATSTLPDLRRGSTLSIEGHSYTVRAVMKIDDGEVSHATLSRSA